MYHNIEIDHIFTIVNKGFEKYFTDEIKDKVGFEKKHVGQGTSAKFLPFTKNYLEFIWLSNQDESELNQLQLHKRFLANKCPFGIAFRGSLRNEFRDDFIEYSPTYTQGTGKILVHKSHFDDFNIPMLFVMDFGVDNSSLYPMNNPRHAKDDLIEGEFSQLLLTLPKHSETIAKFPNLTQEIGNEFKINFTGVQGPDLNHFGLYFKYR